MRAMNQVHRAQQIELDRHNATSGTLSSMLEGDSGEPALMRPPRVASNLGERRIAGTQRSSDAPLPPSHHHSHFHHSDETRGQKRQAEELVPEGNAATKPARTCTNCGTQDTATWRRSRAGDLLCNPCGLYLQSHSKHRPKPAENSGFKRRATRPMFAKAVVMKETGPPTSSSSSPEEKTTPPPPPLPCLHKDD